MNDAEFAKNRNRPLAQKEYAGRGSLENRPGIWKWLAGTTRKQTGQVMQRRADDHAEAMKLKKLWKFNLPKNTVSLAQPSN